MSNESCILSSTIKGRASSILKGLFFCDFKVKALGLFSKRVYSVRHYHARKKTTSSKRNERMA